MDTDKLCRQTLGLCRHCDGPGHFAASWALVSNQRLQLSFVEYGTAALQYLPPRSNPSLLRTETIGLLSTTQLFACPRPRLPNRNPSTISARLSGNCVTSRPAPNPLTLSLCALVIALSSSLYSLSFRLLSLPPRSL